MFAVLWFFSSHSFKDSDDNDDDCWLLYSGYGVGDVILDSEHKLKLQDTTTE